MTKLKFLLCILLLVNISFSQEKKQNSTSTIYILGGIVSAITQNEINFSKKYNVAFHDFGCTPPANFKDYEEKNKIVFNYLKEKFGTNWETEINQNTLGYKNWKIIK